MCRPGIAFLSSTVFIFTLMFALTQPAQAQTFNLLYTFTSQKQGAYVYAGLAMDRKGNLYGTASRGGENFGTAYQLVRKGSGLGLRICYTTSAKATALRPTRAWSSAPMTLFMARRIAAEFSNPGHATSGAEWFTT